MSAKYYTCKCQCGVLCIQYDPDWGLELSMFSRHPFHSFRNRVRIAWKALCGNPYTDMVILDEQQIADIVDELVRIQNINDYK